MPSKKSRNSYEMRSLWIASAIGAALMVLQCCSDKVASRSEGHMPMVNASEMFSDRTMLEASRAIDADNLDRLRTILNDRATVNAESREGATLLLYATGTKRKKAMRELLKIGANPNHRTKDGLSPLMLAAGSDDSELLEILLEAKADPNVRNDRNEPVLFTAAASKRWDNLATLLSHGADINATSRGGMTLILYCAEIDDYERVMTLLERGADFRKADSTGSALANFVQESRLSPTSADGVWLRKVKTYLEGQGVTFPVPNPSR